jgi:tRNA(fMet)-specific endonuclease VapC
LFDTTPCIAYLTGRSKTLMDRLRNVPASDVALGSVVKAELLFGARKSAKTEENLARLTGFFAPFESIPFDDHTADVYGQLRADLDKRGTPVGPNDRFDRRRPRARHCDAERR